MKDDFNLKNIFGKQLIDTATSDYIKSVFNQFKDGSLDVDRLANSTSRLDKELASYINTNQGAAVSQEGFAKYVQQTGTSLTKLSVKSKIAKAGIAALNATATMGVSLLASFAIEKIISWLDKFKVTSEEIAEAAESAMQKIEELNDTFEQNKNTVDNVKRRYAELAQGVDLVTNKNLTLSNDDYKEFLDLSNQLVKIFPNLTQNYDSNGNAILNLKGDVNSIVGALDELIERQRQITNDEILKELPDVYSGYKDKVSNYKKDLSNAEEVRDLYLELFKQINEDSVAYGNRIVFNLSEAYSKHAADIYDTIVKSIPNYEQLISEELDYSTDKYTITIQTDGEFEGFDKAEIQKQLESAYDEVEEYSYKIEQETSSFSSYINTWLQGNWLYQQQDPKLQEALKQVLFNKSWIEEAIKDPDVDEDNWDSVAEWIEENYIKAIGKISNEEYKQKFIDLFTLDLDAQDKIDLAQELQAYFDKNEIKVSLGFILDENNQNSTANLVERAKTRNEELASSVDELKQKYEEAKKARQGLYQDSNYVGNVDINNRPIVTDSELGGSYQTSYTGYQEYWKGDEETGGYHIIHFTPILPDGTVLDDKTLYNYLDNVIAKADNALEADKTENGGLGILYKVDTTVDGEKITDENLERAFNEADQWDIEMHKKQAEIYDDEAYALIAYNEALEENDELTEYFNENINTEEKYNAWLEVTKEAETAGEAIRKFEEYANKVTNQDYNFFTDENIDAIDAYQDKISDLSSYLEKLDSGAELSESDMAALNVTYGVFADSAEEYRRKIVQLMNDAALNSDIITSLANAIENCGDEAEKERLLHLYNTFRNIAIEAQKGSDSVSDLSTTTSKLESSAELLRSINESIENNGYIDSSQLSKILSVYPTLAEKVAEYNAGLITSQELFESLAEAYEKDKTNYAVAVSEKLQYDEKFYNNVVNNMPTWLKDLASAYNVDFKNYKNLIQAKLDLDKEFARKEAILTSAINANEKAKEIAENSTGYTSGLRDQAASLSAYENMMEAQKEYDDYKKIIDGVNTTLTTTLDLDTSWKSFGKDPSSKSGSNSGSDSGSEFSNEIDWVENSLSNINREIDAINGKIGNTTGFKERLALYEDLNEANQKLVDATGKAVEAYEDEWIEASSKISSAHKNKIISGDTFAIEDFSNETLYNNVSAAKEAYEQWQSSIQEHNQALAQQKEDQDSYTEILLEQAEIKLDIISLDIEEADTAKQKNKLLDREKAIKKQILEYNLSLADSEEEKLKLQKEYNNYLSENEKTQYDNTRQEINNKIGFYDSYIQDIQNAIELAEAQNSQATELQYREINNYLDRQIELEQINYNNALKKRDGAAWGSDEWNQYNDEIQEAQDKIQSCTIAQIENNKAILSLPIQKYEKLNEELQEELDALNEYQSKVENAIGYASTLVQDQIDILNNNKESVSDYWDEQIEAVQNEKDALTESNDELQKQIDLENAKYNLEKAMNNKTSRVYRKGEGFVYEADQDAVREAQEELDNLEYNNAIDNLDKTIEALEEQKEDAISAIDSQIKAWEEYADKIDRVTSSYENFMAMQDLIQVFGSDAIANILNRDEGIISNFEYTLNSVKTDADEIQQKIEANERLITSIQQEVDAFTNSSSNIVAAKQAIKEAITNNEEEILAIEERRDIAKELSTTWTSTKDNIISALGDIDELNISSKDLEFETLSERIKNLQDFEVQATNIYTRITKILAKAKSAMQSLESLNGKASDSSGSSDTKSTNLPKYHTGGIVGKDISNKKLPEHLMSLADSPLKPNETLAKLLNGEVVLNNNQMGNLFNNLSKVSMPLATNAITKNTDASMSVSIGDVNVYNPDNSDMIVNEIVKELPLKVIQKLNSK